MNAPRGVLTQDLRAQIADGKEELLRFLHSQEPGSGPPPVSRREGTEPAPLSLGQERLWFLEQLEPGSGVYNVCRAYRLKGSLNLTALEISLNEIVRRHEVLRSAIKIQDQHTFQIVQQSFELEITLVDLQSLSHRAREDALQERIREAAETRFDFSAGRFLRAEMLRIDADERVLILTTHHIVSDAWSMGILSSELWALYGTYSTGKTSPLGKLPVQYSDFAVWQREWLTGAVLESQLSYWREQLKDVSALELPLDRSRPRRQSYRGARLPFTLSESLTSSINELSNQCGATPFMILLTMYFILLYRYSGQRGSRRW